ncbi:hypothetical protein INT43_008533 [Umbelopsis isabellina]|uniref:Spindle pole body component n=1 Tax=Mortierella isabellina TaxID=91625 RepID=A0A8H7UIE0_MORIS|nr:hypothetical protein INT43_008533 [Umbelopsis isabellina]
MLHELLLVLSGYPGDVFTPSPAEHTNTFAIAADFPLLHDAERAALNRLAHLGWLYSQIDSFVRSIRNTATCNAIEANTPHGSYVQALAVALNSVLKQYREAIIDCEKRILEKQDHLNGAVPIIYIASTFSKWFTVLPALKKLIAEIEEHPVQWHGCRLLNLIVKKSYTGVVDLRDILNDILHQLHIVMYKQITSWMIYGHLSDPWQEFFITPRQPLPSPSTSNASLSPPMPSTATGNDHFTTNSTGQFDHCLEEKLIPSHIPLDLAESILFVGEIVKTVRDNSSAQINSLPKNMIDHHLELLLQLSSASGREKHTTSAIKVLQLQNIVNTIRRSTSEWIFHQVLVGEHDILRYLKSFKDFYLLGQGDFARNLIEEGDRLAGPHIEPDSNNPERRPPVRYGRRQMDTLIQRAQIGCLCEDWPELSKYSIRSYRGYDPVYSFPSFLLNDTAPVLLDYHYRWPLNLFLTSDDMQCYNFLWEFLISLKKVQSKLNSLWVVLRGGWSGIRSEKGFSETYQEGSYSQESMKQRERLVWRVRSKMLFWIDALWYHVQNDVINPSYASFIESIRPSLEKHAVSTENEMMESLEEENKYQRSGAQIMDFEQIQRAHKAYVNGLFRDCLLDPPGSARCLQNILEVCLKYCQVICEVDDKGDWSGRKRAQTGAEIVAKWTRGFGMDKDPLAWVDEVLSIEQEFAAATAYYFKILSRAGMSHEHDYFEEVPAHLDLFLARLDYNKWFSVRRHHVEAGRR